ncbi:MAG: response regulator [Planctomycetes bacterium]|nr:response regulator [Planctomycetota bacterium]
MSPAPSLAPAAASDRLPLAAANLRAGNRPARRAVAIFALFATQLLLALSSSVAPQNDAVTQSIAWFASGVGVSGVWLLGSPGLWAVVAATLIQRLMLHYAVGIAVPEALGSGLEALVGAWILRRCGLRRDFSRLQDVGILALAAGAAPFVSITVSFVGRGMDRAAAVELGLLSGWVGWWCMNALGVVVVVPTALTWHDTLSRSSGLRVLPHTMAFVAGAIAWLGFVVFLCPASSTSVTLLSVVLLFALMAALRHGPVGATTVAACSAAFLAVATTRGYGPFLCVPLEERHAAAQVFLLTLVIVPLVFGALVARQRELEAQLRLVHKMEAVGMLAGGVAHDFNNLLTIIAGNADDLRTGAAPGSPVQVRAAEIVEAAQRGAGLTRQLLAFGGRQILKPGVFELGAVVAQSTALLRRLLGDAVRVEVVAETPVWVRADLGQLEQVVMNLVINSRDAMPDGGVLTLTTRGRKLAGAEAARIGVAAGEFAELEVRDTGHGMSAEVQARAFEPFFTTKGQGGGSGLGLATVYGIAKQSCGGVAIDSDTNRGTTVHVWLPSATRPVAVPQAPAATDRTGSARRVLVVDDERALRDLMRRVLAAAGYVVFEAEDGEHALSVAETEWPIDLLITDLVMPRLGGGALAKRLRALHPSLPVLFVTAHPRSEADIDFGAFAAADLLGKPFSSRELLDRTAALLALRR